MSEFNKWKGIAEKPMRAQCNCSQYPFPHRKWSGKCEGGQEPEPVIDPDGDMAMERDLFDRAEAQAQNDEDSLHTQYRRY